MNKFLEGHKFPKLGQKGTGNTNSPKSIKEIEFVAKKLPTR